MSFGILVGEIPAVFNVELYVETLQFQEKWHAQMRILSFNWMISPFTSSVCTQQKIPPLWTSLLQRLLSNWADCGDARGVDCNLSSFWEPSQTIMVNEFWWRCFLTLCLLPGGMGIHYQIMFHVEYWACIYIYMYVNKYIMMLKKKVKKYAKKNRIEREREKKKKLTRSWSIFSQQTEDLKSCPKMWCNLQTQKSDVLRVVF